MSEHIKDLLKSFLKDKADKSHEKETVDRLIVEVAGEKVAKYTKLDNIYKNKVYLVAQSSEVAFELKLIKNKLLEKIKAEFPEMEDVKIKI